MREMRRDKDVELEIGVKAKSGRGSTEIPSSIITDVENELRKIDDYPETTVRNYLSNRYLEVKITTSKKLREQTLSRLLTTMLNKLEDVADEVEAYVFKKTTQRSTEWWGGANCLCSLAGS